MMQMLAVTIQWKNTDVMATHPFLFVKQGFGCIMTDIFSVRWSAWSTELII
jgi:hypothetical protein